MKLVIQDLLCVLQMSRTLISQLMKTLEPTHKLIIAHYSHIWTLALECKHSSQQQGKALASTACLNAFWGKFLAYCVKQDSEFDRLLVRSSKSLLCSCHSKSYLVSITLILSNNILLA